MADPYWPRPVVQPQPAGGPAPPVTGKRLRSDFDSIADQPYIPQEANRGALPAFKDVASINASYERYLSATQMSSDTGVLSMSARPPARVTGHPFDHPQGINSLDYEGRRDEAPLPPDASSTLYVEGLPSNCTRREVAHIFRPFLGYKEVRIVHKDPRHPGQDRVVLCFVDFASPAHAASALNALQGYVFDETDRYPVSLRLQFARYPGSRFGGGQRSKP
ncbi:hypothetical protein MLD38_002957 [Melastoma candidum]|uniref:Uncharacterized protein n=1 Tax=Melastoma candidum TaxID=119954 RepID=A0ACB9S5G3_9MYRT|nr:hypothetical protein MLD38_002957 [Melastoma candidum]